MEVLLAAVGAVDDDAPHPATLQQGLVDRQVREVGDHLVALGVAHRLGLLGRRSVEGQRRVVRVAGERVWRQCVR